MKKCCSVLLLSWLFSTALHAQFVFDRFDTHPDSHYVGVYWGVNDTSRITLSLEETIVHEGNAALRYDWRVERDQPWGGIARYEFWHPDAAAVWDFSAFENLSIWYYNDEPSSDPGHVHFRLLLFEVSDAPPNTYAADSCEVWYSFEYILDDPPGWQRLLLPLEDVGPSATSGSNGFWRTGWSGITGNNLLDLDQVKGFGLEVAIDGPALHDVHRGAVIFDYLTFEGARELPLVFFNGMTVPSNMAYSAWNGILGVDFGSGHNANTNALKWIQDPGQPWSGFIFQFEPRVMTGRWPLDTLRFWMKAPDGAGTLRVQFGDSAGTKVKELLNEPAGGYGNSWTHFKIALQDIDTYETGSSFDTAAVSQFEIMAEGSGNGHTLFFDEMWTGSPTVQWLPPPLPPFVVPETYANLIIWIDVPGQTGEVYNIYYSRNPISDIHAEGVEVVEQGLHLPENRQAWRHYLFSPLGDSLVSYYYALTVVDAAGNESFPATTTVPIVNTARGIATLSQDAPTNFTADGDFAEWDSIEAFRLFPSEGAHVVANTTVNDDADLSLQLRLAGDSAYLYFAFEVGDDLVDTTAGPSGAKDSPALFLGLYDHHGRPHNFYERGAAPDYHFRFLPGRVMIVNLDSAVVLTGSSGDYYWGESAAPGYVVEGRISWSDIAAPGGDEIFVPVEGARIPFDLAVNDADGGGTIQGILTWSPYNEATSWMSPNFWLYSWVGERDFIQDLENPDPPPGYYALDQNYPNPFNPATTIRYRLPKTATVTLTIYNILGQEIRTLLHDRQPAGENLVVWDGRDASGSMVSSGIYIYRMSADGYIQSRKMLLLR